MEYFDYPGYQEQAEDSADAIFQHQLHLAGATNGQMADQSGNAMYHAVAPPITSCDVRPRLTKEQADLLEANFQMCRKPTTTVKRTFAETLGVPAEKVNNWFQNRRAKAKQEAKKAAGQAAAYETHSKALYGSDSESSPFQPSQQYAMMQQHLRSEEDLIGGLGMSQAPHQQPHAQSLPYADGFAEQAQLQTFTYPGGLSPDAYANDPDQNRRTLTQENFNEMYRERGMLNTAGQFESLDMGFSGDHEAINRVFPDYDQKSDGLALGYPTLTQPLSSNDSTIPSDISEQSLQGFSAYNMMQHHASMSAPGSDWTDSRSSSLASSTRSAMGAPMMPVQSQPQPVASRWEPGQSVPVDPDALKAEFEKVSAAQASMDLGQDHPLAYPQDDAYARRDSSASLLAQHMGDVGLHTPQPNQSNGEFKVPLPSANIAARRQRRAPANLSLRSQSLSGPGQPSSPGYQHNMSHSQQIRRAASSTVLNGVAQGRIMKSGTSSGQRSPLNWSFNANLNSPHLVRAVSHGNLAPPTPLSPSYPSQIPQTQQVPSRPAVPTQASRQPCINETEEQGFDGISYRNQAAMPPHVSPPHTPHWLQQPYASQRMGSNVIMENTPPQSAPASQTTFSSNVSTVPPNSSAYMAAQQQQYLNLAMSEQQFQMANVTFAPSQHAQVVASGPPPGARLTFATGVPIMKPDGNMQMSFPPQMQTTQPNPSPPQGQFAFVNANGMSPGSMIHDLPPKLATQPGRDFVVHEYSPPDSIKQPAVPRKVLDNGPKSYTFANHGPVDYEEKKMKKDASSSPASSNGTASTS